MLRTLLPIIVVALCAARSAAPPGAQAVARPAAPPVSVFAGLDGTWTGTFVGYDPVGRELYRIRVRQVYETIDDERQTVVIHDTMPDGTVIEGRGENRAWRDERGRLQLRCVVTKSNGDRVEHTGRVGHDPEGHEQLVWSSQTPGRRETFREVVRETTYSIDGMGTYGDAPVLMAGRYRKEEE